jgi:parallel beta-helix repeat protein
MKKKIAKAILLLFFLVLTSVHFMESARASRTWTVDDNGLADFHTIQEAISAASNGDVVLVHGGVYYEHVVINKTIALIGDSPFDTIIDAGEEASASVIMIEADNVTVRNLTLRNSVGSRHLYVGGGAYLYCSNGCTIENCIVFNNQNGINLFESTDNNISHNLVEGNGVGIRIEHAPSSNNLIRGNWILNNSKYGMYVGMHAHNNTVAENYFFKGKPGFLNYTPVSLYIYSPTSGVVYHNDFISDAPLYIDAQMESGVNFTWSKDGEGNFWMNYTGVDTDGDGLGDTPYTVQYLSNGGTIPPTYGTAYDNYPLMKPYNWLQGDVNYDMAVYILDISIIAKAFGSRLGDANWKSRCDLNNDETINILDITLAASNFGKKMSWPTP